MALYKVAISYSSGQRLLMREVVKKLLLYFPSEEIFYDELHTYQLARPNPEQWLRHTFSEEAQLVVVMGSNTYDGSKWCALEQNAISAAAEEAPDFNDRIMLLSLGQMDDFQLGLHKVGYQDVSTMAPDRIARMIIARYESLIGQRISKRPLAWRLPAYWHFAGIALVEALLLTFSFPVKIAGVSDAAFVLSILFPLVAALYIFRIGTRPEEPEWQTTPSPTRKPRENDEASAEEWYEYSTQLTVYAEELRMAHSREMSDMRMKLLNERLLFRTSITTIFLLTLANILVQLSAKDKEWGFVTQPGEWRLLLDEPAKVLGSYTLWATYAVITFLISWLGERRFPSRLRFPMLIGFTVPFYVGLFSVGLYIVQESQTLFNAAGLVELGPGLVVLVERLVLIPTLCLLVAFFAALLQPRLDRVRA